MNRLAESFKETQNISHVFTLTNHLDKNSQLIEILNAAQDLVHEGYPNQAEILILAVKAKL